MDVAEAVRRRRSVRAFKADPVPVELVRDVLEAAQRAPSGGNLQPWRVDAVAGEPLRHLKQAARSAFMAGADEGEHPVYPPDLWAPFADRRRELGESLYRTLGIERQDRAARQRQLLRNAEMFGAPVGLFFSLDRRLGPPQWADLGILMQTVMLLAVERELATCAQAFWSKVGRTAGAAIDLPADHTLVACICLGWSDEADIVNSLRSTRASVAAYATFRGFEDPLSSD